MARKRKHPITNSALAVLLEQTGWSMSTAAEKINQMAGDNGRQLRYRAPSVNHWLTGVQPSPEALPIIVETFARALDRPDLTAEDLGWPDIVVPPQVNPWTGDLFSWLSGISRSDMLDPGGSYGAATYSTAYLSPRWLPQCRRSAEHRHLPQQGVHRDVAHLREGTQILLGTYAAFGGGYARTLGSCFLLNNTLPLLRGSAGTTRREAFGAASEVTCVLGLMCEDAGARARAQQYYILALRLAAQAADPAALGVVCILLARQATSAGQLRAAWNLLNAAENMPQPLHIWICLGRALVHASQERAVEARAALAQAERLSERAESASPPFHWFTVLPPSAFEHVTGIVLMALGDLRGATSHLSASLTAIQPGEHLNRSLTGVRLARLQVAAGRADSAAETVQLAARDMGAVISARLAAEVNALGDAWPADRVPPSAVTTPRPAHQRALINLSGAAPVLIRTACHPALPSGSDR